MPILKKSQYRLQAVNPVPMVSGGNTCKPIGAHTQPLGGRMVPVIGEDMGYLVWRKRNCCLL
jgi:conjugal transfer pilus assembly protein TraU